MTELQNDVRMAQPAQAARAETRRAHTAPIAILGPREHLLLFGAMLGAVAAWLLYRNLGLNPAIFADEWYYSKMSRLLPLSEAIVPSYLYLWAFSASSACGDRFLDCVRIGNVLLYVGAAPFIYGIARQVTGRFLSSVVVLLSLLAPANVYTAYFMPESTYYFGFAVLSWITLTRAHWGWGARAIAAGVVLGLMSLVKVHALFLLPALCLYLVYAAWARQPRTRWIGRGLLSAALAALATVALKYGLGYLFAGETGLSLFGSFYSVTADSTASRSPFTLLAPAFINARGHLMALALLASLPMAILAHQLLSSKARADAGEQLTALHLYALLMLGSGAGLTIAYTASIASLGPIEVVRLHLRYYTFALPLLYIIAAAPIDKATVETRPRLAWPIAIALIAVLLIAVIKLPTYSINPIDGPEIAALDLSALEGRVIVGLDILVLLLWALRSRLAAPLFVVIALPLMMAYGTTVTNDYLAQLKPSWEADRAGRFARDYVPKADHKYITIAASDVQQIMRTQFHIDDKDTGMLELAKGAPIEPYQLPVRNKWLLVVGQHALPAGVEPEVATDEYALVRLRTSNRRIGLAKMSQPLEGGIITAAEGLSHAEVWGRWSDAREVVLHFRDPLPKRVNIILRAQAYAVNATLPFTMRIGDQSKEFRVGASPQEVGLPFVTDGTQRSLTIIVPQPTSPADLGNPADPRKLGIGLSEVEIGTPD